ncbi:MAG: BTAD domain-containing putative transcriptional regulator, partial [Xanthomonadales bacterium]|nr:BTAD domain-containing putative transcriptional regulator [Xanthomonadales bacterium]
FGEGRTRSEDALECLSPGGKTRADLEYTAGSLAWMQGDYTVARERLGACAARCRGGAYDALYPLALRELAGLHFTLGEPEVATDFYDKSIARLRESGSAWDLALALVVQADVRDALGDSTSGRGLREEAQRLFRDAGDPWGLALAQFGLALGAARQKDWKRARMHAREALQLQRTEGDAWSNGQTLALLGEIEIGAGHARQAAGLLIESMRAFGEVRDRTSLVHVMLTLAEVERRRGRIRRAVRLAAAGHAQSEQLAGSYLYALATAEDRVQTVEALRRKAGQAAFDEEWVAGTSLPFDAAVAFAVEVTEPESREIPEAAGGSEAALRVFALGPPAVFRSGRRLEAADWTYALPKELLFYLLVHGPRTKEQIGLVFWPEASTDELRGRFRTTLYQLRRALGGNEWVLFRNGRYEFNRQLETWFDVEAFESGLELAGALADNDAPRAAESLERAVDLYRGDFLEGERMADWVLDQRERLQQRFFDALIMLGGLRTAEGAFDAAATFYRRAVAQDNLDERAHLELARCLALAGDRAAAVRQLDELSQLLHEELDAEPSEAARNLRARLKQGLEP